MMRSQYYTKLTLAGTGDLSEMAEGGDKKEDEFLAKAS